IPAPVREGRERPPGTVAFLHTFVLAEYTHGGTVTGDNQISPTEPVAPKALNALLHDAVDLFADLPERGSRADLTWTAHDGDGRLQSRDVLFELTRKFRVD